MPWSTEAIHNSHTCEVTVAARIAAIDATNVQLCSARNRMMCTLSKRRAHSGIDSGTNRNGIVATIAMLAT